MKTTEIAKHVDVTPNTVRNWTRLYAPHLSPTATPTGENEERVFTRRDMAVFEMIAQLRAEGFNHGQIAARLGETVIGEGEIETPQQNEMPEAPQPPATITGDVSAAMMLATTAALQQIADRLVEREHVQVRRVNERMDRLTLLVWILAALVVVLVIAVVALWVLK